VPWPLRVLSRSRVMRRLAARGIGLGVRPEHVRTRDEFSGAPAAAHDAPSAGDARSHVIAGKLWLAGHPSAPISEPSDAA
jgi:hypothetical protein